MTEKQILNLFEAAKGQFHYILLKTAPPLRILLLEIEPILDSKTKSSVDLLTKFEGVKVDSLANPQLSWFDFDWVLPICNGDWVRPDFILRINQLRESRKDLGHLLFFPSFVKSRSQKLRRISFSDSLPFPYSIESLKDHFILFSPLKMGSHFIEKNLFDCVLKLNAGLTIPFWVGTRGQTSIHVKIDSPWTDKDQRLHYQFNKIPKVTAVIPFKDQRKLTHRCIQQLSASTGVEVDIIAVDNNSQDQQLANDLEKIPKVRVIHDNSPFNYSYLCNLGARQVKSEYILFLNNDVFLDPDCLFKMLEVLQAEKVAACGALLTYENGLIQHDGINFDGVSKDFFIKWGYQNYLKSPSLVLANLDRSFAVKSVPAITGACMLVRTNLFRDVAGFDEIMTPIGYSDTNLCLRLRQKGFHIMQNSRAHAQHFEGASRGKKALEDFESSLLAQGKTDFISVL